MVESVEENEAISKRATLFLLVVGISLNPWTLGYLFAQDSTINSVFLKFLIILFEVLIMFIAVSIYFVKPSFVHKWKEFVLFFIVIFFCLLFFECLLRMYPLILGQNFANGVLGKYNTREWGIYYYDPLLKINFMKPSYNTTMYYSGYTWSHSTDSKGFRNDVERETADIVLLGDSYIYGHGVENNQTVARFIESLSGYSVINLGKQGDCSYQELYMLYNYGISYKPKYVIYFFYDNDLIDLYIHGINISGFLTSNESIPSYLNQKPVVWQSSEYSLGNSFLKITRNLYLVREINMIIQHRTSMEIKQKVEDETEAWKFTEKAIVLMNTISQENNATLVIIPLVMDNSLHADMLNKIAQTNSILIVNTTSINRTNPSLFLVGDGHFSEEGAKAVALLVTNIIQKKKINK